MLSLKPKKYCYRSRSRQTISGHWYRWRSSANKSLKTAQASIFSQQANFAVQSKKSIHENVNIYFSQKLDVPKCQAVVGLMTPRSFF